MANYRRVLGAWAHGGSPHGHGVRKVIEDLSPNAAVPPDVRKLILARLVGGDDPSKSRRRALVALKTGPSAGQLDAVEPLSGITADHWTDLRAGAAFMDLRSAALAVLYRLEERLLQLRDANEAAWLPFDEANETVGEPLAALHQCAR